MSNYHNNIYKIFLGENVMTADNQQGRTQKEYRILNGRPDIPTDVYLEFRADSDNEARRRLREVRKESSLAWDDLLLVRVDQREVTTNLDYLEHI